MAEVQGRKHTGSYLAKRILKEVWNHPNNRDHRVQAVGRSMAWQVTKRISGRVTVRPVYGHMKMWMDPRFGSVSNFVYFGDRFDVDEMDFMSRYLRPGDRFLDVGANIGAYTLFAASLTGPNGNIDAIEAVPVLATGLRANIELNGLEGRVTIYEVAASDHSGEIRFRVDRDVTSRMAVDTDPDHTVKVVPCSPLDDLISPGAIALAKIDVEGAEVSVLRGMSKRLRASDPPVLLLEVLPNQLKRQGQTVEAVMNILDDNDYVLASWSACLGELTIGSEPSYDGNVIAVSRQSIDAVTERLTTT